MKTAKEILSTMFGGQLKDYVGEDQMWIQENIVSAMKEYAEQALEKAAEVAMADLTIVQPEVEKHLQNEFGWHEGVDYEVAVHRSSILNIKNELE